MDNPEDVLLADFLSLELKDKRKISDFLLGGGVSGPGFARPDQQPEPGDVRQTIASASDEYYQLVRAWDGWPDLELHQQTRRVLEHWRREDQRFWESWWDRSWRKVFTKNLLNRQVPPFGMFLLLGVSWEEMRKLARAAEQGSSLLPAIPRKAPLVLQGVLGHGEERDIRDVLEALEEHLGWLSTAWLWAVLAETFVRQEQPELPSWLVAALNSLLQGLKVQVDGNGLLRERGSLPTYWAYRVLLLRQAATIATLERCTRCGLPAEARGSRGPRSRERLCRFCREEKRRQAWRDSKRRRRSRSTA